ncbi:MAG: MlaD family protein [Pseudomonadota bacterium]|nr:MlaD family protein [Pseudomonadota bacterium]
MTPSPNRQAVIVGLFVASAVVILAGGILTIGDLNDTFTKKMSVTAVFEEVNGLQQGDNIWYSGVKVGIVKTVGFHGGSQVEIEMRVDREAAQYIHQDALAKIGSDGLIGSKIVVLYGGTPEAPSLQPGTVLQTAEMISTETILAMVQENNTNLLAITTDLKGISGRIATGEGTIGKLLKEDELYTNINGTVASLNTASASAETLTASLSTFAGKLNKEGSLPNELVTDRTTYAALTGTVDKLQHAGTRASDLMDGLAKGAADPNSPVGTLMHDQPAGTDLKVTLDNMNKSSVLLTENLAALQDNFLLRGYFKKQERAAAKAAAAASADARDADAEAKAQAKAGDTEAAGQ